MTTPVTIVCGFLGAGKSTLLNRLLREPQGERLGVIVNDFGAINIDKDLIKVETSDQIELSNGCVCCSMREDLASGLVALSRVEPGFSRVVVECSGVSNPVGVLGIFELPVVSSAYHVDGVFCVVDCDTFEGLDFKSTELAIDQAAFSDVVLLNKVDLADKATIYEIVRTLRGAQPHMRTFESVYAAVPREALFGPRLSAPTERAINANDHSTDYMSAAFTWDRPLGLADLEAMTSALPPGIIRAKGIFALLDPQSGGVRRALYHSVGKRSSLEVSETGSETSSRAIFIGRAGAFCGEELRRAVNLCAGAHEISQHSDHQHPAGLGGKHV